MFLLPQSREGIGGRSRAVTGVVGGDEIEVIGRAGGEISECQLMVRLPNRIRDRERREYPVNRGRSGITDRADG